MSKKDELNICYDVQKMLIIDILLYHNAISTLITWVLTINSSSSIKKNEIFTLEMQKGFSNE